MPGTNQHKAGHDELCDKALFYGAHPFLNQIPGSRVHKKKAAWFPGRPFLSHGSSTLTGDFRTSAPGAYLPAAF
jgi:hypothetical protein